MKKFLIILIILIAVVILVLGKRYIDNKNTVKIEFNSEKYSGISAAGLGISLYTTDAKEVTEVVNFLNSITYYKQSKIRTTNNSPDTFIALLNKDMKTSDVIEFYGDLAKCKNKQYKILTPNFYDKLGKVNDSIMKNRK